MEATHVTQKNDRHNLDFSQPHASTKRILVVDGELLIRQIIVVAQRPHFLCVEAESVKSALAIILTAQTHFDLLIVDAQVARQKFKGANHSSSRSKSSRVNLIRGARRLFPLIPLIVMSERNEIESVINALRVDLNDYPIEPFDLFQLLNSILFILDENRPAHHTDLDRINRTWKAAADALTTALAAKDTETNGHAERVVRFSLRLGRQLRLSPQQMIELELGSRLHDIGKIGVPDAILRKPAPLNEAEWLLMREHPRCGEEMVRASNLPEGVAQLVGQHHEHWNGCGYPRKLSGNDISILARIFSVIDTFDAITSDRVYRAARPYKEARRRISEVAGTQFDPVIVTAFLSIDESEWEQIRAECSHKDCPKTLSSAVS